PVAYAVFVFFFRADFIGGFGQFYFLYALCGAARLKSYLLDSKLGLLLVEQVKRSPISVKVRNLFKCGAFYVVEHNAVVPDQVTLRIEGSDYGCVQLNIVGTA